MNINFKISDKLLFVLSLLAMMIVGISMMEDTWCETGSAIIWSTYMLIVTAMYITHKFTKKKEKKDSED